MNDFLKKLLRIGLIAGFWVFALSININGRTIFSYAHETLVQNEIVRTIDEELSDLWSRLYHTAQITYERMGADDSDAG